MTGKATHWRFGILVLVFALALLAIWLRDHTSSQRSAAPSSETSRSAWVKGGNGGAQWYESNLSKWNSFRFVSLSSEESLAPVVAAVVEGRFHGPSIEPALLSRDITAHFLALSAQTPTDYAERLKGFRELRNDWFEAREIHLWYRDLFGKSLPAGTTPSQLLDEFWNSSDAGRPKEIANVAILQVFDSRTLAESEDRARLDIYWRVVPMKSMGEGTGLDWDQWLGPFNQVFPRLFQPKPPLESLLTDNRRALVCQGFWVVRTTTGAVFTINVDWFYDPSRQRWHLASIGNCYPGKVCWPF